MIRNMIQLRTDIECDRHTRCGRSVNKTVSIDPVCIDLSDLPGSMHRIFHENIKQLVKEHNWYMNTSGELLCQLCNHYRLQESS